MATPGSPGRTTQRIPDTHVYRDTVGPVNIVAPTASLDSYRAVAFLGLNTMTAEIYANLLAFVKGGGILFLCGCHFDTRFDLTLAPAPIFGGKISELTGVEIAGPGRAIRPGIRACSLKSVTARRIDEYFLVNEIGAGKVYF